MKRSLKVIVTLILALMTIMEFGAAAYADDVLPAESVSYGYCLPDAAAVPMHVIHTDIAHQSVMIYKNYSDIFCAVR